MPLDPPWTHFSLSKYISREQSSSKKSAAVVHVGLALAAVLGPREMSDDLLSVSMSVSCSIMPLDLWIYHGHTSRLANTSAVSSLYLSRVLR